MSRHRNRSARGFGLFGCFLLLAGCAGKVPAPRQMRDLNREALDAYEAGELARAKTLLLKAAAAGSKAGLDDDPIMARTYLDLGAVHLADNDRGEALRSFGIALSIMPDIEPTEEIATPALKKVLAVARVQVKRGRGAAAAAVAARKHRLAGGDEDEEKAPRRRASDGEGQGDDKMATREPKETASSAKIDDKSESKAEARHPADEEPDLPTNVTQPVYCPLPDEAPPAAEVPLRCVSAPTLAVSSMVLFYRPAGSETFTPVPMVRSRKGWYQGVVPASALVGKTLQYYVEAMGPAKTAAASNGQADSPNLVIIRPGAPPISQGSMAAVQSERRGTAGEVEEDPLARSEAARQRQERDSLVNRRRPRAIWLGLGLGSGIGWHPRRQLEFRMEDAVASGLSRAGLMQVTPEIGWQLNGDWAVSVQSRHQIIPESGSGDDRLGAPAHGALAVLLRAYRYFGTGNGQPFLSAAVGAGDGFRLVVPPQPAQGVVRNDTIRGGPLLIGPGAGYLYNFSSHFGWAAEARLLVGLPDQAALIEFSTGAQLAF
jgi:hypothetical protein